MSDDPVVLAPARLIDEPTEAASLLNQSEAQFRSSLDEGNAWKRLKPSLDTAVTKRKPPAILITSIATSVTAMAIGWYAGVHYSIHSIHGGIIKSSPSPTSSQLGVPTATFSQPLAVGESLLADGSRALVGEGTQGEFTKGPEGSKVNLVRGHLELSVVHQARGQYFSVHCPEYELRVLGTQFNVNVVSNCLELQVVEGRVAVLLGNVPVTVIEGGQRWASQACDGHFGQKHNAAAGQSGGGS